MFYHILNYCRYCIKTSTKHPPPFLSNRRDIPAYHKTLIPFSIRQYVIRELIFLCSLTIVQSTQLYIVSSSFSTKKTWTILAKDSYNMFKLKVIHLADLGHIIAVLFLNPAMTGERAKFIL